MAKAVFCIAKNDDQARNIVEQLRTAGFSPNDISVLFPDKDTTKNFAHEKNTKAPEGAATGAASGAMVGGTLGWLAGLGSLAIRIGLDFLRLRLAFVLRAADKHLALRFHAVEHRLGDAFRQAELFDAEEFDLNPAIIRLQLTLNSQFDFIFNLGKL